MALSRRQLGRTPDQWLLAVEVVSPNSRQTDRFFQPVECADAGLPAYWRVEPDPEPLVVVHRLLGDRDEAVQELGGDGDGDAGDQPP